MRQRLRDYITYIERSRRRWGGPDLSAHLHAFIDFHDIVDARHNAAQGCLHALVAGTTRGKATHGGHIPTTREVGGSIDANGLPCVPPYSDHAVLFTRRDGSLMFVSQPYGVREPCAFVEYVVEDAYRFAAQFDLGVTIDPEGSWWSEGCAVVTYYPNEKAMVRNAQ